MMMREFEVRRCEMETGCKFCHWCEQKTYMEVLYSGYGTVIQADKCQDCGRSYRTAPTRSWRAKHPLRNTTLAHPTPKAG